MATSGSAGTDRNVFATACSLTLNGCSVMGTLTATNAQCNGDNGSLNVELTGATAPVSYSINSVSAGSGPGTISFPRAAGTYTVTYTDAGGCAGTL